MAHTDARLLLIYLDETDTWGDEGIPLYEAVVKKLFQAGLSGATVHAGIMGYGANRQMHKKGLFGVTDDRPVTVSIVESEARLRAVLPTIRQMVGSSVIFLAAGEEIA